MIKQKMCEFKRLHKNFVKPFDSYIPYVLVSGSLKMPSLGVIKVNTTNKTAKTQSRAIARLGYLQTVRSLLNCRVS